MCLVLLLAVAFSIKKNTVGKMLRETQARYESEREQLEEKETKPHSVRVYTAEEIEQLTGRRRPVVVQAEKPSVETVEEKPKVKKSVTRAEYLAWVENCRRVDEMMSRIRPTQTA